MWASRPAAVPPSSVLPLAPCGRCVSRRGKAGCRETPLVLHTARRPARPVRCGYSLPTPQQQPLRQSTYSKTRVRCACGRTVRSSALCSEIHELDRIRVIVGRRRSSSDSGTRGSLSFSRWWWWLYFAAAGSRGATATAAPGAPLCLLCSARPVDLTFIYKRGFGLMSGRAGRQSGTTERAQYWPGERAASWWQRAGGREPDKWGNNCRFFFWERYITKITFKNISI